MSFTAIKTDRLSIRSLISSDAEAISYYRSLPEVAQYQSWDQYTLEKARELISDMEDASPEIKGKWFQFGIELNENKKLIGDIGFLNTDATDGTSWIGFTVDSAYWHKGYATEAVTAILNFYTSLGISEFSASIDPKNSSSNKLLEKLGFRLVESKVDDLIFKK